MGKNIDDLPPLLVITGPTATGKSEVAVRVAIQVGGEIVSADSMLVYRHMDIGTAKPSQAEMHGIPHHLISIIEPDQDYSVALFQKQAREVIAEIYRKGKLPILAGGTGLYIRSVIERYDFTGACRDEALRARLLKEAEECGFEVFHRRLAEVDRQTAEKLHPRDVRRVIRAFEVYYLTGRPISSCQKTIENSQPLYNLVIFGLTIDREALYRRIEQRVDAMIEAGLIEEVQGLLDAGYDPRLTSMQGLGYKEMVQFLAGEVSLQQAIELLKRNTRRFAKRQMTWFRRDERIRWVETGLIRQSSNIAQKISRCVEGVF